MSLTQPHDQNKIYNASLDHDIGYTSNTLWANSSSRYHFLISCFNIFEYLRNYINIYMHECMVTSIFFCETQKCFLSDNFSFFHTISPILLF